MIRGIGIDTVQISRIEQWLQEESTARTFLLHTFTSRERAAAGRQGAAYYAARYAVKEAVFKAIRPLLAGKTFDFRQVESLHRADGSPVVSVTPWLAQLMQQADVDQLHCSVTTEGAYATAFVIAEKTDRPSDIQSR